jgi:hypothetical protein
LEHEKNGGSTTDVAVTASEEPHLEQTNDIECLLGFKRKAESAGDDFFAAFAPIGVRRGESGSGGTAAAATTTTITTTTTTMTTQPSMPTRVLSSDGMHVCGVGGCEFKCRQFANLKRHRAAVHDLDIVWYECEVDGCKFRAKREEHVKRHYKRQHNLARTKKRVKRPRM